MVFNIADNLPLKSPLENRSIEKPDATFELTDCSSTQGLFHVRGTGSEMVLRQVYNGAPASLGGVMQIEKGALFCLAEDEFMLMLPEKNDIRGTLEAFQNSSYKITLTDLTHGRGQICARGSRFKEIFSKLCGLDFSDRSFANLSVAQTSFAKVHATIVRLDDGKNKPVYYLIIDRSLADYVWDVIVDAAKEYVPR